MNHRVNSVTQLHDDAVSLYTDVVVGGGLSSAETIINNLTTGIEVLKRSWEGKDAGVQIQKLIEVLNGMVSIRNALGELSVDSSKVAANYREIQNANGAGLESFGTVNCEMKNKVEDYTDNRDTVNITEEANTGKQRVDSANEAMGDFIQSVKKYYGQIMDNWTQGTGRDKAQGAFDDFLNNSNRYKEILNEVSNSITTAIKNYQF